MSEFVFDNEVGLWYKDGVLYDEEEELEKRKDKLRNSILLQERNMYDGLVVAYPELDNVAILDDLYVTISDTVMMMSLSELEMADDKAGTFLYEAWVMYWDRPDLDISDVVYEVVYGDNE